MRIRSLSASLVIAVLPLVACQKQAAEPAAPANPAPVAAAPAAEPAAPAAAPAAPAATASFGVAECDNYVTKYLECIDTKVPEAARQQIRDAFEQTRAAWQQAASTEAGRATLATGCTQATEAAKMAMAAYGCTF